MFGTVLFLSPLYSKGHIVFGDLAFGENSYRYIEEIFGIWNSRYSTSTLFNLPRLLFIAPLFIISKLFGHSNGILLKELITVIMVLSSFGMYALSKSMLSLYFGHKSYLTHVWGPILSGLFYAANPWFLVRIQHVYLLCGYALLPLVIFIFIKVFFNTSQSQEIKKTTIFWLGFLALLISIASAAIHYFIYILLLLTVLFLTTFIIILIKYRPILHSDNIRVYKYFFLKLGIFIGFFILTSWYWLVPYVTSTIQGTLPSQNNVNVFDTITMFSRNSDLSKVMLLISYWWPMFDLSTLSMSFYIGGSILLGVIFSSLFYVRTHKILTIINWLLIVLLIIFASGVYYVKLAPLYLYVVFHVPIIGNLFRDPNKLCGLIAFLFSIQLSIGLAFLTSYIRKYRYAKWIKRVGLVTIVVALMCYLIPFHHHFINGFYKPIEVPEAYGEINTYLEKSGTRNERVLFFPLADYMTDSIQHVSSPGWNLHPFNPSKIKATGDFALYGTLRNTVFQHEGNLNSFSHYYLLLQYLLDTGRTMNLSNLVSVLGVKEWVHQKGFIGNYNRQKFNLEVMDLQHGMRKKYSSDWFNVYEIQEHIPYLSVVPFKIFTPYGYTRLESYHHFPYFDIRNYGTIFLNQFQSAVIPNIRENDMVESIHTNDLVLSSLPDQYYIYPFDYVKESQPFIKWSKTLLKSSEWMWYMKSLGLKHYPFDFDRDRGVIFTLADARLDAPSYMLPHINGEVILSFEYILRHPKFFIPDNQEQLNLLSTPRIWNIDLPMLRGVAIKEDPNNIWEIAKSQFIPMRSKMPYRALAQISGRYSESMHLKIRFFNQDKKELGITYMSRPENNSHFDSVGIQTEFVSPKDTAFCRIDILSMQNIKTSAIWWLHNFELVELRDYQKPNVLDISLSAPINKKVHIFVRAFVSKRGGTLKLNLGQNEINLNTIDHSRSQFVWKDLGVFEFSEETLLSIDNDHGFNAVNAIVSIPEDEFLKHRKSILNKMNKARSFWIMEAESDFRVDGQPQSDRIHPQYSFGSAITMASGTLKKNISFTKSATYNMYFRLKNNKEKGSFLSISLKNKSGINIVHQQLFPFNKIDTESTSDVMLHYIDKDENYSPLSPKKYLKSNDKLGIMQSDPFYISTGDIELTIEINSAVKSLINTQQLRKFYAHEVSSTEDIRYENLEDCCYCEKIEDQMSSLEYTADTTIFYTTPTHSCDWYIFSSDKIPVEIDKEYYFEFNIRSKNVLKRHSKLIFLDNKNREIEVQYFNDIEEYKKKEWHTHQKIFRPPVGAKKMQFMLWARGDKKELGNIEISDFSCYKLQDLLSLDVVGCIQERGNQGEIFIEPPPNSNRMYWKSQPGKVEWEMTSIDKLNNGFINLMESPLSLWKAGLNGIESDYFKVNGLSIGLEIGGHRLNNQGVFKVRYQGLYFFGIGLLGLVVIISLIIWRKK
ncbi:MAG: hypothetical protein HRT90_06870 [Candidatus Margulisbacteria bacterium]|nr:hypothetical protein [Candidatus Margulisiibacteriota bacterium]